MNVFTCELNLNNTKYIESYFLSGVIVEGIAKNIDNIAQTIFNNPDDYLYYIDPIPKVELAFDEEIEFHKIRRKILF